MQSLSGIPPPRCPVCGSTELRPHRILVKSDSALPLPAGVEGTEDQATRMACDCGHVFSVAGFDADTIA